MATPEAVYCYDGKAYVGGECSAVTRDDYAWGAMTGHGTAVSSAKLDLIHPLGVVEKSSQSVVGLSEPKVMQYEYNAGGAITKATYPSGRVVGYTVGAANRVLSVRNGTTGSDYYQSTATYGPHGGMTAATVGGFGQSWQYTSRLQVREMTATAGGTEYKFGLCYWGNCDNTAENGSNNSGNLLRETLITTGRQTITRNYVYDTANRVTSYTEAAKSQGYGYDGFGNLWQTAASEVPALAPNGSAWYLQSGSGVVNNRYNGVPYTDAGDVKQYSLSGGPWEQVYDGEGRLLRVEQAGGTKMVEYDYDAEGRRVRRVAGAVTTHFAYDAGGQLMGEYGGPVAATGRQYLVADHLGSTRMVVSGGVCVNRFDYAPFGAEVDRAGEPCYGSSAEPRQKFTSKERDAETGLDYFEARYFSGGREGSPVRTH